MAHILCNCAKHFATLTARNARVVTIAGLFAALALPGSQALATTDTAVDESRWGQWQPMASGYIARRRQPSKIDHAVEQRRLPGVQERSTELENLRARQSNNKRPAIPEPGVLRFDSSTSALQSRSSSAANTGPIFGSTPRVNGAWLYTTGEGLFSVAVKQLAGELGRSERSVRNAIERGRLHVAHGNPGSRRANQPVSWRFDAANDRVLIPAAAYDGFHTDQDAYRISLGSAGSRLAQQMPSSTGTGPDYAEPQAFRDTLLIEEEPDMMFLTWVVADEPEADYWFWDYLFAGARDVLSLPLSVPNPAPTGTAQLSVLLRGFTDLGLRDEHRVQATLNGQVIGAVSFEGMSAGLLQAEFDQALLNADGNNTLELNILYDSGTTPGQFLDEISLSYDRLPVTASQLWIHDSSGGPQAVTGLASDNILVIENPSGTATLREDIAVAQSSGGDWEVNFEAVSGADYLVTTTSQIRPGTLVPDYAANLDSRRNSADYLIIAPRDFTGTAETLANYRSGRFGSVSIAWLDDIYEEYNAGREEPVALARFMQRAVQRWQTPPSVVMLIGKGSLDQKNRMGYSDGFLPVALTGTPYSLAVSESRLLGFEDNPPFAIGRLPIINDAEGMAYVAKLSNYELNDSRWGDYRALLIADNADEAGDFPANMLRAASQLEDDLGFISAERINHPADAVREQLLLSDTWNRDYVLYDGHGSVAQAGDARENFMLASEIDRLDNQDLPIFAALTCAVGDHSYPATRSLAGALVLNPGGGAISAMAPAGLSLDSQAQQIGQAFANALFLNGSSVGDALREARWETQGSVDDYMNRMYNVVGEPAVIAP